MNILYGFINIIVTFIVILFAFLSAALIYFKSNKVSKIITETIEKYEGYNSLAKNDISTKLTSIGYNKKKLNNCPDKDNSCTRIEYSNDGYCVYLCDEENDDGEKYYYYRIRTNMMLSIPIINEVLDVPIFSNTNRMYDFEANRSEE